MLIPILLLLTITLSLASTSYELRDRQSLDLLDSGLYTLRVNGLDLVKVRLEANMYNVSIHVVSYSNNLDIILILLSRGNVSISSWDRELDGGLSISVELRVPHCNITSIPTIYRGMSEIPIPIIGVYCRDRGPGYTVTIKPVIPHDSIKASPNSWVSVRTYSKSLDYEAIVIYGVYMGLGQENTTTRSVILTQPSNLTSITPLIIESTSRNYFIISEIISSINYLKLIGLLTILLFVMVLEFGVFREGS
ncbi:MAG: hypothetical protein QXT23_01015 [Acidilobaceae archaeon]